MIGIRIVAFAIILHQAVNAWDYSDPNAKWTGVCQTGKRQSPINIVKADVVEDMNLHKLQAVNYDEARADSTYTITNNGHGFVAAPVINVTGLSDPHPYMVFQHNSYQLAQFHFHWGPNDTVGSEHTVDGKMYPLEVHFVHFNRKYHTLGNAVPKSDGLLVLGYLFEISKDDNTKMAGLIGSIKNVLNKGDKSSIPYFAPQDLFPTEWEKYFHYPGSLTTPTCDETVSWFVDQTPLPISSAQLAEFRTMFESTDTSKPMTTNYRPVQPLNGRTVKARTVDKSFIYVTPSMWDYKSASYGKDMWAKYFPICKDDNPTSRQSPIDIKSSRAMYDSALKPLKLVKYDTANSNKMELSNNGHAVSVSMKTGAFESMVEHKGEQYELAQFHFHWASASSKRGSEHTHDGKGFFAEVHFVHYNKKYGSLGGAVRQSDGLLVWGHFIKATNGSDHAGYKSIFDNFANVQHKDSAHAIDYVHPLDLLAPVSNQYYTYKGSLTTPNCFESVTWIVNRDIISISFDQADKMMGVYKNKKGETNKKMVDNWRAAQDINGRSVYMNWNPNPTKPGANGSNSGNLVTSSLVSVMFALICYMLL